MPARGFRGGFSTGTDLRRRPLTRPRFARSTSPRERGEVEPAASHRIRRGAHPPFSGVIAGARLGHGLALRLGAALGDDAVGLGILQVAPERELSVAPEQVGRQDGGARSRLHLAVHAMQAVEPELGIELRRVVLDAGEIVGERRLAEELVDQREHVGRAHGEKLVFDQDDAVGEFRVAGLAQRVPRIADQAVGMRQRLHPRVDGRALGRAAEQAGVLERVVAKLALERIHDPGDVAHAADQLGVGEQPHQRRQLRGPGAIGVEDHRLRVVRIVAVEQAAQDAGALRLAHHGGKLAAGRHLSDDAVEQRGDRARHASMEA